MWTETILFILEIVGTIAFSISGAFVAIKVKFDIFGVIVIGCITSVGGGIIRDILIGATPPAIFSKGYIIGIAALTAVGVFIVAYFNRKQFNQMRERVESVNNLFDSVGLAAFTVMGTEMAFTQGFSDNILLSVTLGVLTGVGGGLLRDILTETSPYIFTKHVYALVSILGSILYFCIRCSTENTLLPSAIAAGLIVVVRLLAARYHWELPKISLLEEKTGASISNTGFTPSKELCDDNMIATVE